MSNTANGNDNGERNMKYTITFSLDRGVIIRPKSPQPSTHSSGITATDVSFAVFLLATVALALSLILS